MTSISLNSKAKLLSGDAIREGVPSLRRSRRGAMGRGSSALALS